MNGSYEAHRAEMYRLGFLEQISAVLLPSQPRVNP
jgi:hypothetical protein